MTRFDSWDSYFNDNPHDPKIAEDQRVLRNLLGAEDPGLLAEQERAITLRRVFELERHPIEGNFDFTHHRAIHRHIFKDVYEWAGEPRTVDMGKAHRLWPAAAIIDNAPSIYGAIAHDNFLQGMEPEQFVARLAEHWGEVNVLHAFREGNTRSQRAFFHQLADQAGYVLDGAHLEKHYKEFNAARESAMLTSKSDEFAAFLHDAVHPKVQAGRDAQGQAGSDLRAQVGEYRSAAFPHSSSEATRFQPPAPEGRAAPPATYGRQADRGYGIDD